MSTSRSCRPDLGEKILVAILVENKFGFIRRLEIFCGIALCHHACVAVLRLYEQHLVTAVIDCTDVIRSSWKCFVSDREVKRNIRAHVDGLCDCRPRHQEQAQHADETDGLPFHRSSSGSRIMEVAHPDLN